MSKLMSVLGIVLLAVGAALALVGFVNPAQMNVYGLTMDTAAILISGGIVSVGLGGVIAALSGAPLGTPIAAVKEALVEEKSLPLPRVPEPKPVEVVAKPVDKPADDLPSRIRFNPFARKTETALAGATAATAVVADAIQTTATVAPVAAKSSVDDTIAALEQAKADIANAIGGVSTLGDTKPDEEEQADDGADDEVEESAGDGGELYVIEEREIRGRPARILSDNTVEAETDEGWMRFENLEHLNEYLDSMGEPA
jgi:hypothetical protein